MPLFLLIPAGAAAAEPAVKDGFEERAAANKAPRQAEKSLKTSIGYSIFKRTFDVVASAAGLLVLSPVLLLTGVAIMAEDGGSPFFLQPRIGKDCKSFRMVKFRSMYINAEVMLEELSAAEKEEFNENFKLKNDPRITKVGKFIRKTSIDELPQLWNVLIGDMSLVGPRPPLLVEEEAYGEHLEKVMSVRPGITGYWQVHGRSDTSFQERIDMNEYYIGHRSLGLDLKILVDTVGVVFSGRGAV